MIEEFIDLEYDPVCEIQNYKGSYPIIQLNKVRRFIINGFKKDINSKIEFDIKRKCAIFTKDILNYMLADKKSEKFDEKIKFKIDPQQNPLVDQILNIDEEDLVVSTNQNQIFNENIFQKNPSLPLLAKNQPPFLSKNPLTSFEDEDIQALNNDLSLKHGCDGWCFRNLPSREKNINDEKEKLIYICDFCHYDCDNEITIKEHLEKKEHGTASEFWQEIKSNDQVSKESPKVSAYDEYFKSAVESTKKSIISIKNRCSIKNNISSDIKNFEVFCPKCGCHFDHKILAACLHFKSIHSPNRTDEVYLIGELIRTDSYEINKVHSCNVCNVKFKKLSDLANHLKNSGHFPGSRKNEMNIFFCPFDNCGFKSTRYFIFKNHIMLHPFFNNPKVDKFCSIAVKVGIYSIPKEYYHLPINLEKTEVDNKNELEAINDLLELNHSEDLRNLGMFKEKKSNLEKINR